MNTTKQFISKTNDIDELDQYLYQTLVYLFKEWYKKDVGIVACCLKDGDKIVYATSRRQNEFWLHAERSAYLKFKEQFGEPSKNAIFIITLSPCLKELKYRDETSCSELLKNLNITRVHFGVLDTFHTPTIEIYNSLGFSATLTKNKNQHKMCQKLMGMFSIYDSRINKELISIKKELGDNFFDLILSIEKPEHKEKAVARCKL